MRTAIGPVPFVLICLAGVTVSAAEPEYLLERVDDVAVVRVYAEGFKDLSLRDKMLTWHLYQASIAGRDIYFDQRYAHGLVMRDVLEAIVGRSAGIDEKTLEEITRYTKLFWINSGPYNNLTARKIVLKCSPSEFAKAASVAARNGAKFPLRGGETLDGLLERLKSAFFDADVDPIVTNKTPEAGKDILSSSANNLYVGVTSKDLEGFVEKFGLNSRLIKRDGKLVEEVYKIGGMYSRQISKIVEHLEAACEYAPPATRKALEALVAFYRSGEDEDRRRYDIAWVQDKDATVDTINGFIEVYMDPRGVKGSWESAVYFVNKQKTENIKKLAAEAQWFEDRMPWDPKYRKRNVKGITANAIDVVIETGDCGPVTPIGINLPNDQRIREQYGSKSVSLSNIIEAGDKASPASFRGEFSWSPDEVKRASEWSTLAQELLVNMHEVIGHASGRLSERIKGQPQELLKEQYSALEEARADLIALYFMPDPRLAELGIVPADKQAEIALTAYENYTRNVLVQLRRIREGNQIEEDHMRNRQMIVRWLIADGKAIDVRTREGKTYYVLADAKAFREGVGRLLAEVQRIKSEGDYVAAKSLFERHGIRFDPNLRDQVLSRIRALNLPSYSAFVMPRLELVKNARGTVTDVSITYPKNLAEQMLEYSAISRAER